MLACNSKYTQAVQARAMQPRTRISIRASIASGSAKTALARVSSDLYAVYSRSMGSAMYLSWPPLTASARRLHATASTQAMKPRVMQGLDLDSVQTVQACCLLGGNGIEGLSLASLQLATRCGDGAGIALLGRGWMQRNTGGARAAGREVVG